MTVYCFGCLLSMILVNLLMKIKHDDGNSLHKIIVAFVASLPLMIISAIRYDVGQDYFGYVRIFRQASVGYRQPGLEIPYYELNRLIDFFGGDYPWIFAICSIVFMLFVFLQIIEDSPYPSLSVFLLVTELYYFASFNVMRQFVGCAILLFSIRYIKKRELLLFGVCVATACCFHLSCLLFSFVYYIYGKPLRKRTLVLIVVAVIFLLVPLSELLLKIVSWTPYAHYIGGRFDMEERGYTTLMVTIVQFLFILYYYDPKDKNLAFYSYLLVISLCLTFFIGKVVLIARYRWLFSLPSIIMLPIVLDKVKRTGDRIVIAIAMVILYSLYFYYTVGINNSASVLPYQTIFSR